MDRKKLIQLIHVGKSKLAIDDETYRSLLMAATGKSSTSEMVMTELIKALEMIKRRGFRIKPPASARAMRQLADYPQAKKLRAMWLTMHKNGMVRDASESALCAWLKRETGVDRIEWLSLPQASRAIEKLKKWQQRGGG